MFTPAHRIDVLHIATGIAVGRGEKLSERGSRSETKKSVQSLQKAWLREIMRATGLKPSQLAEGAGVSDTTITRLLNNPEYDGTLSPITIQRITEKYNVPGPEEYGAPRRGFLPGLAEAERVVLQDEKPEIAPVISTIINKRNAVDAWRLKTNALEQVGYLPGDVVFVDLNAQPKPQDAVCAQVYDWTRGRAETVWRVYDPPFLVGASHDRTAYKPLLVDNDRVVIKGVIVESFRPHALSATR